jgi:hypothetical protein
MIIAFHTRHEVQNASAPLRLSQNSSSTRSVKLYAPDLRVPLNFDGLRFGHRAECESTPIFQADKGPSVARANYL